MKNQELLCSLGKKNSKLQYTLIYSHLFYILTWGSSLLLSFTMKYWVHLELNNWWGIVIAFICMPCLGVIPAAFSAAIRCSFLFFKVRMFKSGGPAD